MSVFTAWSAHFRLLILAAVAALAALGLTILPGATVEAVPEFSPPHVEVQTEALGLSAEEVEQLITSPMEVDILNGVAFLKEMRSESVPGLSSIQLVFQPGTDVAQARQLVAERLTRTRVLPKVSSPPVLMQPLSSTSRVMMVRLSSANTSLVDLSVLARWNIKPRLLGVPGVANVSIWGMREQQMQVQVDPGRLAARGVSLNQVIATAGNAVWVSPLSFLEASTPGSGGFIESGTQRLGIQHVLPITKPTDLARVSIQDAGKPLVLGDVATVVQDHQPLIGDAVAGSQTGLMLVVEKFPGTSTATVTTALDKAIADLRPGLTGVELDTSVYRPATFVEGAVRSLGLAGLVSVLLVALLLGLALRSWRAGLVTLLVLASTLTGAAAVLSVLGVGFNMMIFTGLVLALAIVVGDSVADMHALRALPPKRRPAVAVGEPDSIAAHRADLVAKAIRESRTAAGFAALVAVLVLLPTVFLPGLDGAFLRPLVLSFGLTVAIAMVLAWTLSTTLMAALGVQRTRRRPPRFIATGQDRYSALLPRMLARPALVLAAGAALTIAGAVLLPLMAVTARSVPIIQDRSLLVGLQTTPGTSLDEMRRVTGRATAAIAQLPGVDSIGGHIGRAVTSDQVVGVNSAELWVTLDPSSDRNRLAAAVREELHSFPGLTSQVTGYAESKIGAVGTGVASQFPVRVYGVNTDVLRAQAARVRDSVAATTGVSSATVDLPPTEPVAEIKVNLDAAQKAAILPGEVRRAAAALIEGVDVGTLFEKQKVFQVIVTGVPAVRRSLKSIADLQLDTPAGGHVRLGDVAAITVVPRDTVIRHDGTQRYVDITAAVKGRAVADVAADVQASVHRLQFPREYHAEVPAQFGDQGAAALLPIGIIVAAVLGLLVLLQTALRSWRLAALLIVTLPLALSGGLVVALLGAPTLVTLAGLAVVLAITVRDSVLLVLAVRRHQAGPGLAAVLTASRERALPTVLGGLLTAVALLPLVILGGVVGAELLLPLAAVVWGGILTSWLLTLLVLPVLLLRIGVPDGDRGFDSELARPALAEGTG